MGYFYFDESIHQRGGFIVGAFVFSEVDLSLDIASTLNSLGFIPGRDEFKSSASMQNNPRAQELRNRLKRLLQSTKVGLVVVPSERRDLLGHEALIGLKKILTANDLSTKPHRAYFDEGINFKHNARNRQELLPSCDIHTNQDSRIVAGLQLADLAAHCFSIMLLEAMGIVKKKVKAGHNSGYDPNLDIEIGFEIWATLRYCFFKGPGPTLDELEMDPVESLMFDTGSYALHISPHCDASLKLAAEARFSKCYLGCIH